LKSIIWQQVSGLGAGLNWPLWLSQVKVAPGRVRERHGQLVR